MRNSRLRSPLSGFRFRPTLEALEDRCCPTTISLNITNQSGCQVMLSGHVDDLDPGGLTVQLSGHYSGAATTDATGNYAVTVTASGLGAVYAVTTDRLGQTSNTAEADITCPPPRIVNFMAVRESGSTYTFSGTVQAGYGSAATLVVSFSGFPEVQNVVVSVGSDNTFHFTVDLSKTDIGLVSVQTTDWWGQVSNVAQTYVDASNNR
jgi:hypothetical protein